MVVQPVTNKHPNVAFNKRLSFFLHSINYYFRSNNSYLLALSFDAKLSASLDTVSAGNSMEFPLMNFP